MRGFGGFLFFLAFTSATEHHQNRLSLKPALLVGFFNTQKQRYTSKQLDPPGLGGAGDADPAERAAWAALARAMFNLDEALTKG